MEPKLLRSRDRIEQAIQKIFAQNESFTGQLDLEIHCKDGAVKDVYEIRSRRKV